jgi:hypothetical protein
MTTLHHPGITLALALAVAGCQNAYADTGRDPRQGYPPGASSADPGAASAPPPAPVAAPSGETPWAPAFDVPFAAETSPAPSASEWKTAPIAREARVTDPGCKVRRVREWYQVECRFTPWVELISGTREGLSFGCRKAGVDQDHCEESWVVFPARRGDLRALEFFAWAKWGPSPDAILTEQFLEGDPGPVVTVGGLHWGF